MGSSSSTSAGSASVTARRRTGLSEHEAWDIAMAWCDQLRGCVRLETSEPATSIVPTFDWVTFAFNGPERLAEHLGHVKDPHKTAAYARAATIAWFALSCCEGYGGAENPQFWKRVFRDLLYHKRMTRTRDWHSKRAQRPITDAIRFFDRPDAVFPRIKLVVGGADATTTTECIFVGTAARASKTRDAKLRRILAKLKPHISRTLWMRRVPVQVEAQDTSPAKVAALFHYAARDLDVQPEPSPFDSSRLDFYQIHLQSVVVSDRLFAVFRGINYKLPQRQVDLIVDERFTHAVQGHRMCRTLAPPLDERDSERHLPRVHIRQLILSREEESSCSGVSFVFSAVPHIQSIKSIERQALLSTRAEPSVSPSYWAWLGYAIFHPDAAQLSGLTTIDIDLERITPADVTALSRMSVGNNLLGDDPVIANAAYDEVRVRSSSSLWMIPNDGGTRLHQFLTTAWVGLCVQSADTREDTDWVRVIVPGFGLGWIRQSDIIETRSRPPGRSCLRTLGVIIRGSACTENVLFSLLMVLGDQLTSLDIRNSKLLSKQSVHAILSLCPALTRLILHHDGSFWADRELSMEFPRLEELNLVINDNTAAPATLQQLHQARLPHLKALRVISWGEQKYSHHATVLASFLTNQPVLQYLHLSNGRDLSLTPWAESAYYSDNNDATRSFIRQISPNSLLYHCPIRSECKLAFLCVIRCIGNHHDAVQHLAPDVISLIFQYATSTAKRAIRIDP